MNLNTTIDRKAITFAGVYFGNDTPAGCGAETNHHESARTFYDIWVASTASPSNEKTSEQLVAELLAVKQPGYSLSGYEHVHLIATNVAILQSRGVLTTDEFNGAQCFMWKPRLTE